MKRRSYGEYDQDMTQFTRMIGQRFLEMRENNTDLWIGATGDVIAHNDDSFLHIPLIFFLHPCVFSIIPS